MIDLADAEAGRWLVPVVVADLILSGRRAFMTEQGLPYDVLVDVDGRLIRLQVKSTRSPRAVAQRKLFTPGHLFHTKRCGKRGQRQYADRAFDIVAFVALDIRTVAYMTFAEMSGNQVVLRPPGVVPAPHATRMQNVDQLPFEAALCRMGVPE